MHDVVALGRLAVEVALAAGRLIVDGRPDDLIASATKSSPTDVVTVMDTRSEELIRAQLLAARPDDGIHGEEGADHLGTSPVTWVVDPIDGTVNYLYGIPAYAVSIAAVTGDPRTPGEWEVLAGAVVDPSRGIVYHTTLGGGAHATRADGSTRVLHVGGLADLGGALVGTGFGYTPERRRQQAELLLEVVPHVRDIRRIGSAALDLCMVATGQLDGFYEIGLNPWDLAAGWLLIREAGGVVTGPHGGAPSADLTVAGNPAVHDALAAIVNR
ncbi:inositol monophosphatase family protein [Lapillicoccus sp.]|uniref:inositol monophosphatase family protein n=1 Tax=Lapillicoccus sp. TaxID=1909287 RepID=UPI0025CF4375|nr:inositol monophosphatase family protein [Lapillicoccus sp.]